MSAAIPGLVANGFGGAVPVGSGAGSPDQPPKKEKEKKRRKYIQKEPFRILNKLFQ